MECKKCVQVAVNGILTIPDYIPDIDFIIRVTSSPIIDSAIVIDKQISFSGRVLIGVETVSSKSDSSQTVHFTSFETPFIGLLDHCCARANMDAQLSASIKHQDFKMLNPKCITKLIIVKICVLRLTKSCKPINTHCSEPRLTLLWKANPSPVCPTEPCITTPIQCADDYGEPKDYHLPQKVHNYSPEHAADVPCTICGGKIDPI